MKRILLAGATVLALTAAQPTLAADAPIYKGPAPYAVALFNWTGFYVGVNAGYATGHHRLSTFVDAISNMNIAARTAITNTGAFNLINGGFTGGLQIGYNVQAGNIVWGLEADFNYVANSLTRDTGNFVEPVSGRTVRSVDTISNRWLATVRPRVGLAFDRALFYVTGGLAVTDIQINKSFSWDFIDGCPVVNALNNCHVGGTGGTRLGWIVGAGLEYALGNNWSLKGEYLYADFGSVTYRTFNAGFPLIQWADHTVRSSLQVVRVGANVRF